MVNTKSIHHLSAFTGVLAVLFALFFQVSKGGPFRDINPFGVDPYDAVGSFAFQGAFLLGVLTYARALRLCADPSQAFKVRYIRRGSGARGGIRSPAGCNLRTFPALPGEWRHPQTAGA
jgi:hypothetical protein